MPLYSLNATKYNSCPPILQKYYMRLIFALFLLLSVFSKQSIAKTTWIPVSTDSIMVLIPFVPKYQLPATTSINVETLNGKKTLVWDDVLHASTYVIEVLDQNGNWLYKTTTSQTYIVLDESYSSYFQVRVQACNYLSCVNTGIPSAGKTVGENVIYIHTDLLGSPLKETY